MYPQPSADDYALVGSGFFRLRTELESAGDIYESAQGAHSFMLGPESDVSRVNIVYFDEQVPTFVQEASISPDRGFTGFVKAVNSTGLYAPAQRPGKILLYNDAIYNSDYLPTGFSPNADELNFITPVLDVIQYFSPLASLQSQRPDKVYLFQNLPLPSGTYYLLVPYYGRRYAMVNLFNKSDPPVDLTLTVSGINFTIADNLVDNTNMVTQLTSVSVTAGNQTLATFTDADDGVFDYLQIAIVGDGGGLAGPTPLKLIVSDRVG